MGSMIRGVERYLAGWTALSRDTVRKARVDAVPRLGSLLQGVRHTSLWSVIDCVDGHACNILLL